MLSVHSLKALNTVDLAYDDVAQQTVCCLKNQNYPSVLDPTLHFDILHIWRKISLFQYLCWYLFIWDLSSIFMANISYHDRCET